MKDIPQQKSFRAVTSFESTATKSNKKQQKQQTELIS